MAALPCLSPALGTSLYSLYCMVLIV